jgi:hypothetical protein
MLAFDANLGIVLRSPGIAATEAQAEARNVAGSEPVLTCYEGVSSTGPAKIAASVEYSGLGYYTSYEGALVLNFYMESVPTEAVDVCVMTNTDVMPLPANFIFTAAGAKAVHGDPTTLVNDAKALLNTVKKAAAKIYAKSGRFPRTEEMRDQLRKSTKNKRIDIRAESQFIGKAEIPYVIRTGMTASKLTTSVRLADSRLVTMTYNGKSKKTTFSTTPLIHESVSATSSKVLKEAKPVSANRMSLPTTYYLPNGGVIQIKGLTVSRFPPDKKVYVSLNVSRGNLVIRSKTNIAVDAPMTVDEATQAGLTLSFGYPTYSGRAIGFYGTQDAVNAALSRLFITTPKMTAQEAATPIQFSATNFEHRDGVAYNPANQHFYRFFEQAISGTNAFAAAKEQSEFGLTGYMASITDAEENDFVTAKIPGAKNVWIGATDEAAEGVWKWVGGPDEGKQFWNGNCIAVDGSAYQGGFAKWATGEPNNYVSSTNKCGGTAYNPSVTGGEDCVVTNWDVTGVLPSERRGFWNDIPCSTVANWDGTPIGGYVVEFGNKPVGGDFTGVFNSSTSMRVALPTPVQVAPSFFKKVVNFLKISAKAIRLPKKPQTPPTFTFSTKVIAQTAGTYEVTVKRADGRGVPFELQPDSSYTISKKVTYKVAVWKMIITTTKDNQVVTLNPVLKTADRVKPKDTRVFFQLKPERSTANVPCFGSCQSATVPVLAK